jgi:FkbM family methyltransferase
MGRDDLAFLERHVKPGMTVVDVGANLGLYSLAIAKLVGESGRVYSFEPSPSLYCAAARNIERNNRGRIIRLENVGLGSKTGTATLDLGVFNSGNNRLVESSQHATAVQVPITRLDDILPDLTVDWIKIDSQGWEIEVLRGMKETLRRNRSVCLYFEYWPAGLRHSGEDPASLTDILQANGFSIFLPDERVPLTQSEVAQLPHRRSYFNLVARRNG